MPLDVAATVDALEASLRAIGTPERAGSEKAYLKSDLAFLGATVWQIRDAVKAAVRDTRLDHGELVALVGTVTAVGVGLGNARAVAILWTLAAAAAVAFGASVPGPLTGESAVVPASLAVGTWFGAVIGAVMDRLLRVRRAPLGERPVPAPASTQASARTS